MSPAVAASNSPPAVLAQRRPAAQERHPAPPLAPAAPQEIKGPPVPHLGQDNTLVALILICLLILALLVYLIRLWLLGRQPQRGGGPPNP